MAKKEVITIEVLGIVRGLDKISNQSKKIAKELSATQAMSKKLGISVDGTRSIFKQAGMQMSNMGAGIRSNNKTISKSSLMWDMIRKKVDSFSGVMGMNFEAWQGMNKQGVRFNTMGGKFANITRKMTHGMKGFKMEMLGVMFFGMALLRAMNGLLKTSLQWAGVSEVLSAALGILFLPIALKVLDWALKFLDWVSQLSEEEKTLIGWIVLSVAALGGFLMIIGQIGLGVGSVIKLFSGLAGSSLGTALSAGWQSFMTLLGGSVGVIAGVIAAIVLVVVGMVLAWRENFMHMKEIVAEFIDGVKLIFGGLIEIFKGIFAIIKAIFTGDADLLIEGLKMIFDGFVKFLTGLVKVIFTAVAAIVVGVLRIIIGAIQLVVNLLGKIPKLFGGEGFKVDWLGALSNMPKMAQGGMVPGKLGSAVPIIAHAGERVVPVGGGGSQASNNTLAPNITINVASASESDIFALTTEISRRMGTDFERLTKTRATF